MITVIADDITGAAEIAGVAWSHGVNAVLSTDSIQPSKDTDVLVIATDTRSCSETDAIIETQRLATQLLNGNYGIVFKKTDSVLRGHIIAELDTLANILNFEQVLLLPQNPSKGRKIEKGNYYINDEPLSHTAFKNDPEFPATSSSIQEILCNCVNILELSGNLVTNEKRIYVAEASTNEDISIQLGKAKGNVLLAGGADLFKELLQKEFPDNQVRTTNDKIIAQEYSIIVCGSTQSEDITLRPFAKVSKTYNAVIPENVFKGESAESWLTSLPNQYLQHKSIAITIGQKENGGSQCAVRLRKIMAEAVQELVTTHSPALLIIEGGATAYSIIKKLHWDTLVLKAEYSPGIVGMTHCDTEIILKPGSYPWGSIL